ncbi:tetratricopeptide repeat protein [Streptomyces sp. NPDC002602]|uniref:tetratricopeptide repeat protein n=1 Tax=Streptomyces sp. NPDC002602 TaxID=3364654 RepID=UPI0036BBE6B8
MQPGRLALVRVAGRTEGSGYLIGPQLVLTALHVVTRQVRDRAGRLVSEELRQAGELSVLVGHPRVDRHGAFSLTRVPRTERRARVCWPYPLGVHTSERLDLALLWLDRPVETAGEAVRWGEPAGTVPVPYEGLGYPLFAETDDEAHVEHLRGRLPVLSTAPYGWVLDARVRPAMPGPGQGTPWSGASGGAVFSLGRLVGVVVGQRPEMGLSRLHAHAVGHLFGNETAESILARHGGHGRLPVLEKVTAREPGGGSEAGAWPVTMGTVPTLASAFQARTGVRERIDGARTGRAGVVLTQVLSGGGGVGKTQLAAAYAHEALAAGTDLVVWVDATDTDHVITQYARTAHRVGAPGAEGRDSEADARAFLSWLRTTSRSWLVVLDDLTDLDGSQEWWPQASPFGSGRVVATTRRTHEPWLSGGGRAEVAIDTYTQDEAHTYLHDRLTAAGRSHLLDGQATPLASALGLLPLALAHAAAYMIAQDEPCSRYLGLFSDSANRLAALLPRAADAEGYGRQVDAALLLSLDAAQMSDPVGLAVPALRLAAILDPAGHPQDLWADAAVTRYLGAHQSLASPSGPSEAGGERARAARRLLHRYGLITDDSRGGHHAVRIHALTARAAMEIIPDGQLPALVRAAADALLALWPRADHTDRDLGGVLRANTDALRTHAGDLLWVLDRYPVLYQAAHSLYDSGLYTAGITDGQRLAADSKRLLGPEHPNTLTAQGYLAAFLRKAGRIDEAIALLEQVTADSERVLGPEHPDTLTARGNLAGSYGQADRIDDAIALETQGVADHERLLGPEHPHTLIARGNLAASYWGAGRIDEAVALEEQVAADSERLLGDEHPHTLLSRANLAASYRKADRINEAIAIEEQVAAARERLLGPEHPDTLAARANLAASYQRAGRVTEAIVLLARVVADRERVLGPGHPDTVIARGGLALMNAFMRRRGRFTGGP